MESDFEKQTGVIEVVSGYSGGEEVNPAYSEVASGGTGHLESVKVIYDEEIISYEELLDVLWKHIDPTDSEGSFVDRGHQYTSAIFYTSEEEREIAEKSKEDLADADILNGPIVTEIREFVVFYEAEEYHQDYYLKNPVRYGYYRSGSGRDAFLERVWGM